MGQICVGVARDRKFDSLKHHGGKRKDILLEEFALIESGSQTYTILIIRIIYASDKSAKRYQQTEIDNLHDLVQDMPQCRTLDILCRMYHIEIKEFGHMGSKSV
jgi:hypothetical protein